MIAKTQAQLDASARWRDRNREEGRIRAAKWRAENKDRHRAKMEEWNANNPEKVAASLAVRQAVHEGRLLRQLCLMCGEEKTEAHHASYAVDMWLNVVWLCRKHHREVHAKGRPARPAVYGRQWTTEMVAEAAALRNSGAQWRTIGARFGVCGASVKGALTSRGVKLNQFSRWGPK